MINNCDSDQLIASQLCKFSLPAELVLIFASGNSGEVEVFSSGF